MNSNINTMDSVKFSKWILSFSFLALFGATYHTIKLSFTGHEAVIDKNYYEKGLNYEKEIADNVLLKKEGYRLDSNLLTDSLKVGSNPVEVKLFLKEQKIQTNSVLLIKERPATEKFNSIQKLEPIEGNFQSKIEFPFEGDWRITLRTKIDNKNFERSFLVNVK
jgi:hypothetical protein